MAEENSSVNSEIETIEVDLTSEAEPKIIVKSGGEYNIVLEREDFEFSL